MIYKSQLEVQNERYRTALLKIITYCEQKDELDPAEVIKLIHGSTERVLLFKPVRPKRKIHILALVGKNNS